MKEKLILNENYITIQGWMVTNLKLKGNELLIFALIYGFCQLEGHKFNGSLQYLADWTNSTKQSCINNLKLLQEKELIIKEEKEINGIKYCTYSINFNGIQKSLIGIQKSLTNNINNNNSTNNINIISTENLETNTFDDLKLQLKDKKENDKKQKKIKDAITIKKMLDNFTENEEVKEYLQKYLDIRKKKGLTPEQWKIILDDLRKECKRDKNYAIQEIKKAIAGGWMKIIYIDNFKGKTKTTYSSKPNFDNTSNHNAPKGISSMTKTEKENFINNDLARDENGNLLKF